MPVPVAPMYLDYQLIFLNDNIWLSWKVFPVYSVPVSHGIQELSDFKFNGSVPAADTGHIPTSFYWSNYIQGYNYIIKLGPLFLFEL